MRLLFPAPPRLAIGYRLSAMRTALTFLNGQPASAYFRDNAHLALRTRKARHGCCADLHRSTRRQRLRGSLAADAASWCRELEPSKASGPVTRTALSVRG